MKNLDFELFDFGILAGSFTGDLCSSRHAPQSETDAAGYIRSYAANLTKLKVPQCNAADIADVVVTPVPLNAIPVSQTGGVSR
jgi:hypothetical protein